MDEKAEELKGDRATMKRAMSELRFVELTRIAI